MAESVHGPAMRLKAVNNKIQIEIAEAWAEERNLLRKLIDLLPDYLFVKDRESRFLVANKALASDTGVTVPDELIGKTDLDFVSAESGQRIIDDDRYIIQTGQPLIDFEELLITASGVKKWLSTTKVPLLDDQHRIVGIVGMCRDITDRKRADFLRNEEGRILEMIATNAALEDVLASLTRVIESQLEGITGSILLLDSNGIHLRHGAAPNLPQAYTKAIDGLAIGPKAGSCGTAIYRRKPVIVVDILQDPLWEDYRELAAPFGFRSCWSTPIISHDGKVLGTFAMYSSEARSPTLAETRLVDMATRIAGIAIERRQTEERIHYMAHHDALTGLPNRALLRDRLAQIILYAQRYGLTVTVAFIDLDNFKLINDGLGHNAGDEFLKIIAGRMSQCVRQADTVVRLGGDEFVILFPDLPAKAEAIGETFGRLQAKLAEPVHIDGQTLQITCSMGAAIYPKDGADVETLLMNADAAMYRAKELGRNRFQFYTAALSARNQDRLRVQESLHNALARNEFLLLYQPQVDLRSGQIFAVEALIRWRHPELGIVPSAKFIPQAEEASLIMPIGDWVLLTACRQNKAWQDAGASPISISVNVSARQFMQENWVRRVASSLQESRLEAKYLDLELTESLIMRDAEQAAATMKELKEMGVQLSIDDFGIGYSSLNALKSFPVIRLKLDRSFVRGIPSNDDDKAIAKAVISLGHQLNLRVLAEGVETEQQLDFLRENDCDEYQGYYFSAPVDADEILKLLKI